MVDLQSMFILMAIVATYGVSEANGECGLPFFQYGDDCLYFSAKDNGIEMTWEQAREACKLIGGDLAYNFSVDALLKDDDFFAHGVGWSSPWVGGSNHVAQGMYTWLDSNRVVIGPWYADEPSPEAGVPNCVWLSYHTYNDVPYKGFGVEDCAKTNHFMCQKL